MSCILFLIFLTVPSVVYGRVEELGEKIKSGLDIRLLIHWVNGDRDRVLTTQRNAVQDTGEVMLVGLFFKFNRRFSAT